MFPEEVQHLNSMSQPREKGIEVWVPFHIVGFIGSTRISEPDARW